MAEESKRVTIETVKNIARLDPEDTTDDQYIRALIDTAERYLLNACDLATDKEKEEMLETPTAVYFVCELSLNMYLNRGEQVNGLSYPMRMILNQLKFMH